GAGAGHRAGAAGTTHCDRPGGDRWAIARPAGRDGRLGPGRRPRAPARRHVARAAAPAGGGRDLRPQARQGRGEAGLVATGRRAGQHGTCVQPLAGCRGTAGRGTGADPRRNGAGAGARCRARDRAGGRPGRHRHRLRPRCVAPRRAAARWGPCAHGGRLPHRSARPGPGPLKVPPGTAPRVAAARVLDAVLHHGRSLKAELAGALPGLADPRDRALVEAICLAALRQLPRYDAALAAWLPRPLARKDRPLRALLIAGFAQLDPLRLPPHAAVASTVEAARALGRAHQAKLVNALLRRAQREGLPSPAPGTGWPDWLLLRLRQDWPRHWKQVLAASSGVPPMWLRVNAGLVDRSDYLARLEHAGIRAVADPLLPDALRLDQPVPVAALPGFDEGLVSVQDGSAQQVAEAMAA